MIGAAINTKGCPITFALHYNRGTDAFMYSMNDIRGGLCGNGDGSQQMFRNNHHATLHLHSSHTLSQVPALIIDIYSPIPTIDDEFKLL
jgi:hypothetical protein